MSDTRKILVVGDDPAARKSVEEILSGKGHAVITASSGEDALWKLGDGGYAAVFTDMEMRGMSGLDVAEEIHARQPGLPVVVISGEGSGTAQEGATTAGVAAFLRRPLSPEQLANTVGRVLQAAESGAALQPQPPVAKAAPAQALPAPLARLKDIVLFLLAPFVGLVYIVIFPVVGLGMLASLVQQEPARAEPLRPAAPVKRNILRAVAMLLVVALAGIGCAVVAPILGIGLLLWFSIEAWGRLGAKAIKA